MTRFVFALGCLLVLCASANAATIHRYRLPKARSPMHEFVPVRHDQRIGGPAHFAVPGWSDGQTQYWLDSATAAAGLD